MFNLEKNSFILYTEYFDELSMLSDQEAGMIIKAVYAYECGREMPELSGRAQSLFSIIQQRLDEKR